MQVLARLMARQTRADVYVVLRNLNGGIFPATEEAVLSLLKNAYADDRFKLPMAALLVRRTPRGTCRKDGARCTSALRC